MLFTLHSAALFHTGPVLLRLLHKRRGIYMHIFYFTHLHFSCISSSAIFQTFYLYRHQSHYMLGSRASVEAVPLAVSIVISRMCEL